MNIGLAIRNLRKKKGIDQIELSRAIGTSQSFVSAIERGQRPGKQTLEAIAKALGVSVAVIYIAALEPTDFANTKKYIKFFHIALDMLTEMCEPD